MSDNHSSPTQAQAGPEATPEELDVTPAANEADALSRAQAELAELQAKSATLADQFLRAKAEADNARRRAEEEISKARKVAVEGFADSLLPVVDSLEAGLGLPDATTEQIREGAQATLRQLLSALERNKVNVINPPAGSTRATTSSTCTWRAIACAVCSLSPVSITTRSPDWRSRAIAGADVGFTVSATAISAWASPSMPTHSTVFPCSARACAEARNPSTLMLYSPSSSGVPITTALPPAMPTAPCPVRASKPSGSSTAAPCSTA